jgi:hypothetical protein
MTDDAEKLRHLRRLGEHLRQTIVPQASVLGKASQGVKKRLTIFGAGGRGETDVAPAGASSVKLLITFPPSTNSKSTATSRSGVAFFPVDAAMTMVGNRHAPWAPATSASGSGLLH